MPDVGHGATSNGGVNYVSIAFQAAIALMIGLMMFIGQGLREDTSRIREDTAESLEISRQTQISNIRLDAKVDHLAAEVERLQRALEQAQDQDQ